MCENKCNEGKCENKNYEIGEYSYTETIGDLSVKHCFKTKDELLEFSNSQKTPPPYPT